jgi:hypothetical protein
MQFEDVLFKVASEDLNIRSLCLPFSKLVPSLKKPLGRGKFFE